MFGSKQDQKVENGSIAIQATGNVSYGLTSSEVIELCQLVHDKNFPILRAEAQNIANERVREFAEQLGQQIIDTAKIDTEKFKDPDVQACLYDAVSSAARRGADSNPETLQSLIIERVSNQTNTFKDIVISESILVVPKLTPQHISTLCLIHIVQSMYFNSIVSLSELEFIAIDMKPAIKHIADLTETHKRHMQYAGVCLYTPSQIIDPYAQMYNSYKSIGYTSLEAFRAALIIEAPTFSDMVKTYGAKSLFNMKLTSVGQAIALVTLSKHMQNIDLSIWLS